MRRIHVIMALCIASLTTASMTFQVADGGIWWAILALTAVFVLTFASVMLAVNFVSLERQRRDSKWRSVSRRRTLLAACEVMWIATVFFWLSADSTYMSVCIGRPGQTQVAIALYDRSIGVGYANNEHDWYPGIEFVTRHTPRPGDMWFFSTRDESNAVWFDLTKSATLNSKQVVWSIPLWTVVLLLTIVMIRMIRHDLGSWSPVRCPECGYHRHGVDSHAPCPECGLQIDPRSWPLGLRVPMRMRMGTTRHGPQLGRKFIIGSIVVLITGVGAFLGAMADSNAAALTVVGFTLASATLVWSTSVRRRTPDHSDQQDSRGVIHETSAACRVERSTEIFLLAYVFVFAMVLTVAQGLVQYGLSEWILRQRTDASLVSQYAQDPSDVPLITEIGRRLHADDVTPAMRSKFIDHVLDHLRRSHASEVHTIMQMIGSSNVWSQQQRDAYFTAFITLIPLDTKPLQWDGVTAQVEFVAQLNFPAGHWLVTTATPLYVRNAERELKMKSHHTVPISYAVPESRLRRASESSSWRTGRVNIACNNPDDLQDMMLAVEIRTSGPMGATQTRTQMLPLGGFQIAEPEDEEEGEEEESH